jgi:hypothetical protein
VRAGPRWLAALALVWALQPAAPDAAELRPFGPASYRGILEAHAGRPFVLAFWSVHCAPCLEDLVLWSDLQKRGRAPALVLVSTDGPEDARAVSARLATQPLGGTQTWVFADEYVERLRHSVDRTWRGELPRTYFFDASHRVEVITGRIDATWLGAWAERVRR